MTPFDPTSASRAVLIEVMNVLGVFRDEIVLVGGWVPDLLYPGRGHMGSLDVDLAVSRRAVGENAYKTILGRMHEAGYSHHTSPTHFTKKVAGVDAPVRRCKTINYRELQAWDRLPACLFRRQAGSLSHAIR